MFSNRGRRAFIIWQSQSYANPCALIGSFSVGVLQYGPFPWRSKPRISVLSKAGKYKICNQNSEKNVNVVILHSKTTRKSYRLKFYRDLKDGWRRRTFSKRVQHYPEYLATFDAETETGITESQEAMDDFVNQQKSANTNMKTATDMNSLLRYMEANLVWKMRKLKAYLRSSLTTFRRIFFERTQEKRRRIRARKSFQFSAQLIQRWLSEKKYPFNILKDNECEKFRKVQLQLSESHLFTSTAKETNRKLLRPSTKTKRMRF